MTSIIIPCLNEDSDSLYRTIEAISDGYSGFDMEIIVINDGSVNSDGSPKPYDSNDFPFDNTIAINRPKRFGVGAAFDLGVKYASGDTIVLCGADILPERGKWLTGVLNAVKEDEVGCPANVGLHDGIYDLNEEGLYTRYGADLLYMVGVNDLPKNSPLRKNPNYTVLFEGKFAPKRSDEPYEISCLMGAFYFCKKSFYERIHGFDTDPSNSYSGHWFYGSLEPYLSLKAKVYGGKCTMYPGMRVGHQFSRVDPDNLSRAIRPDAHWWNRLFIAHTMLEDSFRDEVLAFPNHELNLSLAQVMIKRNWETVQRIRERNKREGKLITK